MSDNRDHNKGQTDASEGKYEPPIGHVEGLFTWTSSGCDEIIERNGSYSDGWKHGNSQK